MTGETSARPLRVMHVVEFLALAGMEYGVIKITNRLDPRAVTPFICCLSHQVEITKQVVAPHVTVVALHQDTSRNWGIILRLARLFREKEIDVVHSHNWQTYFYAVLGARLAGVPVVIHGEHGHDTQAPSWRRLQVKRAMAGLVNHFVAVSEDLARELVQDWRLRPERLTPIANGVDLEIFRPEIDGMAIRREFGLDAGHRVILNVGGLRRVKDHPTLIRALARLLPERPETRLLIVGSDFLRGLKEEIDHYSETLGVTKQIVYAGTRKDIPEILAACDVYVNSSTFEGMSNTILEAMAMARPVVATAVGGNVELVIDGETGFLVPAGDDGAIAARIRRIFDEPAVAASLGAAGRRRIESHHAIGSMVRGYADLYAETHARILLRRRLSVRSFAKRTLARAIIWTGGPALLRAVRPRSLRILTYHRILPLPDARRYAFQGMVLARDEFQGQIAYLARHYRPLPLGEALDRLRAGTLPKRAVAVTFDDGYRDNYQYAFPILKRFHVPATFFLVTDCLDRGMRLWWDEVAEGMLRAASNPASDGNGLPPILARGIRKDWRRRPAAAAAAIVSRLNDAPMAERESALQEFRAVTASDPSPADRLMMNWEEAREMSRSGMTFGTHSRSHPILEEVDAETAYRELADSSRRIGEELGTPVRWLAYPRGHVIREGTEILRRAGIEAAVTTLTGFNGPSADLYVLRRIDAGFARLDAGFDGSVFEAELAGGFARFRGA